VPVGAGSRYSHREVKRPGRRAAAQESRRVLDRQHTGTEIRTKRGTVKAARQMWRVETG